MKKMLLLSCLLTTPITSYTMFLCRTTPQHIKRNPTPRTYCYKLFPYIPHSDELHKVASDGCLDWAQWCINKGGISVNKQDKLNRTPLHEVVLSPYINQTPERNNELVNMANLLIENGANPTMTDIYNKTPLDYVHDSLAQLESNRRQTLYNTKGELMVIYYQLEQTLMKKSPEVKE